MTRAPWSPQQWIPLVPVGGNEEALIMLHTKVNPKRKLFIQRSQRCLLKESEMSAEGISPLGGGVSNLSFVAGSLKADRWVNHIEAHHQESTN